MSIRLFIRLATFVTLAALAGCGDDDEGGDDDDDSTVDGGRDGRVDGADGSGGDGSGGDGTTEDGGGTDGNLIDGAPPPSYCEEGCACSDGMDNDGDGDIDSADPECTGPADNDEESLATGIPGDNRDNVFQDCFFDGDSGHGNDGCMRPTECFYDNDVAPDPGDEQCEVSSMCIETCGAAVPNGCDCFGCCTLQLDDGTTMNVSVSETCSTDNLEGCEECAFDDSCANPCGRCELCPGRTIDELPADCGGTTPDGGTPDSGTPDSGTDGSTPPGPGYECEGGQTLCDATTGCSAGYVCMLGCCVVNLI